MKNKFCYVLLGLIVSFSFVNNVFANDFVISADVDNTTVVTGNEVSVKVNLKSSEAIKECLFKFENDSNIEFVTMNNANGWVVNESGVNGVSITNSSWSTEVPTDGQAIAELKYKVNGNGKVTIKTVQCVSTVDDNSYKHDDVVVNFTARDLSEDTTLSSLTVTGGQLSPNFASNTNQYIIKLDSSNFGLSMTTTNPDYQDKIVVTDVNGNAIGDLSNITFSDPSGQGLMPITVVVNGGTTYSLIAEYSQQELDNSLTSITINGKELTLVDGQLDYEYTVGKDVTELTVEATLADSTNFKFSDESNAPGNFSISDVANIIIVIEPKDSQSGAKKTTYTIEVVKEGSQSGSNNGGGTQTPSTGNNNSGNNNSGSSNNNSNSGNNNVNSNPTTGDISMFLMAFILIASLVGSIILYQKNLQSYK